MTPMKLYFTPALLLLVLSYPVWVVSRPAIMAKTGQMNDSCVLLARTLLENITDALMQPRLFNGINCTREKMELNLDTRTPSVCSPQGSTCSGLTTSAFDQESCMQDIGKDLNHYYNFFSTQPDPDSILGSSVLYSLQELMENCFRSTLPTNSVSKESLVDHSRSYNKRLRLCKVMKGFHVRTITINRAISYMNLGEHTN